MSSHSKKILKKLAEKPILPLTQIEPKTLSEKYAVARSLKSLVQDGYVEKLNSGRENYLRLTKKGKIKLNSLRLLGENTLVSINWDGMLRIIILDLPEDRKSERESLRYLLKKANFVCLKNTVWVSPLPYENLFTNIKNDLGLTTEMMIIITQFIDEETKKVLFEAFGK